MFLASPHIHPDTATRGTRLDRTSTAEVVR